MKKLKMRLDNDNEAPKIKSYEEAINALEDVSQFLECKGHMDKKQCLSAHSLTLLLPLRINPHNKLHWIVS